MQRLVLTLTLFGIASIAGGVSGISSIVIGKGGTFMTHFPTISLRIVATAYGIFLLFLSWGVYKRLHWVWKTMFLAMFLAWVNFIYICSCAFAQANPSYSNQDVFKLGLMVAVLSLFIVIYWSKRWYNQKFYFE
jgi:hypothetical protein